MRNLFIGTLLVVISVSIAPIYLVAQVSERTYTVDSTVRDLVLPWQAKSTSTNWRSSSPVRTVYLSSGGRWRNDGTAGTFRFTPNVVPPHRSSTFDPISETTFILSNDSVYRVTNDVVSTVGKLPFVPQSLLYAWGNRVLFLHNGNLLVYHTDGAPVALDTLHIGVQQTSFFDNVVYVATPSGVLRIDITTQSKQTIASIPGAAILTADNSKVYYIRDTSLYIAEGDMVTDTIAVYFRHSAYSAISDGVRLLVLGEDSTALTTSYSIDLRTGSTVYAGHVRLQSSRLERSVSDSEIVAYGSPSGFVVYSFAHDQYSVSKDYQNREHSVTVIMSDTPNRIRCAGIATGPTLGVTAEKVAVFFHYDPDNKQMSDVFYTPLAPDEYHQPTRQSDNNVLCFATSKRVFAFSGSVQEIIQSGDIIIAAAIDGDTVYYSTPKGLYRTNRSSAPPIQMYSTEGSNFAVITISVGEQGIVVTESMPGTPPTRKHSLITNGTINEIGVTMASQYAACIPMGNTLIFTGRYFVGASPRQRFKIGQLVQGVFQESATFDFSTGAEIQSFYGDTAAGVTFPWGIFLYDNLSKHFTAYSPADATKISVPFYACSRPHGGLVWAVANEPNSPRLYQLTLPVVSGVPIEASNSDLVEIVQGADHFQVLINGRNVIFSTDTWTYDGRLVASSTNVGSYLIGHIPFGSLITIVVQNRVVALLTRSQNGQLYEY